MKLQHPLDWFGHLLLCMAITVIFGWKIATAVGITIEGAQIESGFWQKWDHLIDLLADAVGIGAGLLMRSALGMHLFGGV